MPKKEKAVGETVLKERTHLGMGALTRLLSRQKAPKSKLTRREKRRKKNA